MIKRKFFKDLLAKFPWLPYVAPFAIFILLTEPARYFPNWSPWLYISKTVIAAFLLWTFRDYYKEDLSAKLSCRQILEASIVGLLVFGIWIWTEGKLFQLQSKNFFYPYAIGNGTVAFIFWMGFRFLGSSLVVPVMEELFWRSMLMRWLINPDFKKVPLGTFSWFSFISTAVLFGLEHNRILAGISAGVFYNLLMIYQKNLKGVILAHGITNFGLGIYVIMTKNWIFW